VPAHLRDLPSVDRLLADPRLVGVPRPLALSAARIALERASNLAYQTDGPPIKFVPGRVYTGTWTGRAADFDYDAEPIPKDKATGTPKIEGFVPTLVRRNSIEIIEVTVDQ